MVAGQQRSALSRQKKLALSWPKKLASDFLCWGKLDHPSCSLRLMHCRSVRKRTGGSRPTQKSVFREACSESQSARVQCLVTRFRRVWSRGFVDCPPVVFDPWCGQCRLQQSPAVTRDCLIRQWITMENENPHFSGFLWLSDQIEREDWPATSFETANPFFRPEFQIVA